MISVVLADDHQLFRKGIKNLLSGYNDIIVIAEASNGHELLHEQKKHKPDVVIADLSMPGLSGLKAIEKILKHSPQQYILALSMHAEKEYVIKSYEAGVLAYLMKDADESELIDAIRTVAQGKKYQTEEINNLLSGVNVDQKPSVLTERELQVLQLVSDGKSTKMIASELGISTRTVETHRVNTMNKLNAHNTAELIKKAIISALI